MGSYDQVIPDLMRKHAIPGGAVAVLRDGKLIYARGFGYADVENKAPAQPDALFRIASVSKPITGVAIMKLVEEGELQLDDRVAPLIAHLTPAPGATVDPRWEQITIRQLLNHTAGWDRDKPNGGFDPMFRPAIAAAAVGAPAPASAETVIRYMKGLALDFDPGTRHVYSNFGYAILGRVIERLSGMPYEEYVRARVLLPVGAKRTRLGRTRMSEALAGEAKYYMPGEPALGLTAPLVPSVFPGEGAVPITYGGFYVEAMDSHGGWVSSSVDLLRFMSAVDGRANRPDILSAALVAEIDQQRPCVVCRRVPIRRWMARSPDPGRCDVVAWRIAARHVDPSRALVPQLFLGRAVQRARDHGQLRRRARCRAVDCAGAGHVIADPRPVLGLPMTSGSGGV